MVQIDGTDLTAQEFILGKMARPKILNNTGDSAEKLTSKMFCNQQ